MGQLLFRCKHLLFDCLPNKNPWSYQNRTWANWLRRGQLEVCQTAFWLVQNWRPHHRVKYNVFGCMYIYIYVCMYVCIFFFFAKPTAQTTHPIFTRNGSKYVAWRKEVPFRLTFFFIFTFWGSFWPKTQKNSFGIGVSQPNTNLYVLWFEWMNGIQCEL